MREPVVIERGDPDNGPGLPRPLARHDGVLRPVPFTNGDEGWGLLHYFRAEKGTLESLCLVCGEEVDIGYIFTGTKDCPRTVGQGDLNVYAADNGPLHERCAKTTVAHCATIRNQLLHAETFMIPYCRHFA